ncbi:MAG: hypothetical protein JNM78_13690 [Cyclobacteriaceae bacterium]|nr:hypothetical protein [Cyclobacteriaceae bacterium]
MAWSTLYITGKKDFQEEVLNNLRHSDVSYLPGSSGDTDLLMLWVDEKMPLRDIKVAIGSKTVFKYRLLFFTDLDQHRTDKNKERLTPREEAMIREMSNWEARYRHSA